jgi:hypothetical protein
VVNSRYPDDIGINGITGNGSASRMEKEKNDIFVFKTSAP